MRRSPRLAVAALAVFETLGGCAVHEAPAPVDPVARPAVAAPAVATDERPQAAVEAPSTSTPDPEPPPQTQVTTGPPPTAAKTATTQPQTRPRFSAKSALLDPSAPGYPLLQAARDALHGFPADALGNVDWAESRRRHLITPRASIDGDARMRPRDDDIVMRNTREMPWVRFPHREHTAWLDCSNCHPRPFVDRAGANRVSMDSIMRGEHCGLCHDRVAFSIFTCERCHSIPHPGSPPSWW